MIEEYKYFDCRKLLNYLKVKDLYSFHYLICYKLNGKFDPEKYNINKNLSTNYIDAIREIETYEKKLNNINTTDFETNEEISCFEYSENCPCKKMQYYIKNFGDIHI